MQLCIVNDSRFQQQMVFEFLLFTSNCNVFIICHDFVKCKESFVYLNSVNVSCFFFYSSRLFGYFRSLVLFRTKFRLYVLTLRLDSMMARLLVLKLITLALTLNFSIYIYLELRQTGIVDF